MNQVTLTELEEFVSNLESENIDSFKEEILSFIDEKRKILSPDEISEQLKLRRERFLEEIEFEAGELVQWKIGLKNRRYPKYDEPAIVMEVLDKPVLNDESTPASPYYKEELTVKIGFLIDGDNDFLVFLVDKKRLKKYQEPE